MALHRRGDSFGEFVAAHADVPLPHTAEPAGVQHDSSMAQGIHGDTILDLRDVERRLDERRQEQQDESAAIAAAVDPALALAAEPVTMQEPEHDVGTSTTTHTDAPQQESSSWSGALWSKLSALRSFAEIGASHEQPSSRRRRPSVVRHAPSLDAPVSGAPGFDPNAARHWNTGSWSLSAADERRREQKPIPVTLHGRRDDTDPVIDAWHAARLQASLPRRLRLGRAWHLLYSLDQHGTSLSTLYDKVARAMDRHYQQRSALGGEQWLRGSSSAAQQAALGPTTSSRHVGTGVSLFHAGLILAVTDAHGNVFGAFINEALKVASHYYGSGECFLWKTVRRRLPAPPSEAGGNNDPGEPDLHPDRAIEVFPWTGRNDYVVLSESDFLSVGGGDGRYGLWLDDTLDRGTSARCPAFDNEVLCNDAESDARHATDSRDVPTADLLGDLGGDRGPMPEYGKFQVMGVEVWAVGTD
ncbi:oxidation resistance protein 1 [Malassezia brasiliensis]|uniref:Oxidation resistance protein 1 n=1 Tax=Malassezia brasiliensis TaxID=1821822 RepID=A0AAF0DT03_9BASI|nr:oxidation resistance protein 1 [Malassezia brasiliensis]